MKLSSYSRTRKYLSILFTAWALLQLSAAAYYWYFGGYQFAWGPIRVRLDLWETPWIIGAGLWFTAFLARPAAFFPEQWAGLLFDPWSAFKLSSSPGRRWALAGFTLGAGIGFYLTFSLHYIFSYLALKILLVAACASAASFVHYIFFRVVEFSARFAWDRSEQYAEGLRSGWYILIWLLVCRYALPGWEGRYLDPLWPLAAGFAGALALIWAWFAVKREGLISRKTLPAGAAVICLIAAAMVWSYLAKRGIDAGPRPKLRVLVITLDTTRPDHFSCYGYWRQTTPHIDEVAAEGVLFKKALCALGSTEPSHASIFTGAYPRTHGLIPHNAPITGAVDSLPLYFQNRGFSTAAVISRGRLDPDRLMNLPGFGDTFIVRPPGTEATAPAVFRRAANWLTKNRDRDVFMWVHFFDPHHEYLVHPDLPRRFSRSMHRCNAEARLKPKDFYDGKKIAECVDAYDEEIAYMDLWIGRLLDWMGGLEPSSELPPLIVLIGDHGEALGEYQNKPERIGFGHPANLYEGVSRIPFIISWPGRIPEGVERGGVAESVDLAPTLVEMVFGKDEFHGQGHSLLEFIRTGKGNDGTGIVQRLNIADIHSIDHSSTGDQWAVYGDTLKEIIGEDGPLALYNVETDTLEEMDLLAKEPSAAAILYGEWNKWKERTPLTPVGKSRIDREGKSVLEALGYIQ